MLILVRYESLLQWQQKRSKATMWLLYKIPAIRGCPRCCYYLTAVCSMLLPHNPYRLPQHYKRHICGPSCSCKLIFVGICLNYMGTVCHWQPFWLRKSFRFIGQCWYCNPQWTPEQAIIKTSCVKTVLVSWEKCAVTKCRHIYRCLWRGLGSGRGTFWCHKETLTFKGLAA